MFVFICFPSLPPPSALPSSGSPLLAAGQEDGGAGRGGGGQPSARWASQTQLRDSLLVFSRKLEHFSKWKIFGSDVLFSPKHSFPANHFDE